MPQPVEIRAGGYQPPASVHNQAMRAVQEEVERRLGDAAAFTFTENIMEQGHNAADLLTMTESGELTLCYFSTSYLAERVPEFGLLDLPFVFRDREHAYAVLDGPFGDHLRARLEEATGYRLLALWDNGFRHISNRVRELHAPEDCDGLRIRTLLSDLHQRAFAMMGFEPVPLDVKDLLTAVREGTVDAQDNALTNIYNFEIYRQHRYITLSSHFFGAAAVLGHASTIDAWEPAVRDEVRAAVHAATASQRAAATAEDQTVLDRLATEDSDVRTLTDEERAAFVTAVAPLLEEQRARFGAELFDLVTLR
ncbi:MAG: TRAP transporter substrate-binding protein [Dehalococcoidia bacterium]